MNNNLNSEKRSHKTSFYKKRTQKNGNNNILLDLLGLLTLILSFAALAQQLLGAVDSGEGRLDLAADVPGFGAVAYWYEEQDHLRDRDWNQAAEEMVRCHGWLDGSQWMLHCFFVGD